MSPARRVLAGLVVLLAALCAPASASQPVADERILSFLSDVRVERDGTLDVTETIRIQSAGERFRRGLLRDFPTRYEQAGRSVRVGFDVQDVQRDGRTEPWQTERIDNGVRVRIGDAERLLEPGEHSYVIRYRTTRQLGFFPRYDELYWNATGTGWEFPIDLAEARIRLPQPAPFGQRAVYTGPEGSTDANAEVVAEGPGEIMFRTTSPLGVKEGLTVAVAWSKGIVQAPKPPSAGESWIAENGPLTAAIFAVLAICAFYFHAWKKAGRGPLPGTIVPLFAPPAGMSAAALRFVRRMRYDNRAFAAAIVESGVRGKLRLVEEEGGFFSRDRIRIDKQAEPHDMPAPEREMLSRLFSRGNHVDMDKENHAVFSAAQKGLEEGLDEAYLGNSFHTNKGWAWAGLLLIVAAMLFVAVATALADPYADKNAWFAPGMGLALAAAALLLGPRSRLAAPAGSWLLALLALGLASVAIFMVWTAFILALETGEARDAVMMLAPLLTIPLALSAFRWMAAPTREGRKLMDEIAGFEKYLSVTEEHRLETLHPPEKTPELFERYLPHAIALGVENRWAARFSGVLQAASSDPARSGSPGWYSGSQNVWSNPGRFASTMGATLTSSVASASTAPGSSSGSGGGGSSGGGGGGGGGGGW
jgi:uncharacterized membrane protein YgcG